MVSFSSETISFRLLFARSQNHKITLIKQTDWMGPQEVFIQLHTQSRVNYKIRPGCSRFSPAWSWKSPRTETAFVLVKFHTVPVLPYLNSLQNSLTYPPSLVSTANVVSMYFVMYSRMDPWKDSSTYFQASGWVWPINHYPLSPIIQTVFYNSLAVQLYRS